MVSFDRAFQRPMVGLVTKKKNQSVDVLLFSDRGPLIRPSIRHIDDPFLLDHPEAHQRGVFVLSDTEKERIATRETLARLMVLVEEMARDKAVGEGAILASEALGITEEPKPADEPSEDDSIPLSVRRKPGRPRRQTVESAI